jgi:aminoglycoside phosphotransferase (APT) family kinase protein
VDTDQLVAHLVETGEVGPVRAGNELDWPTVEPYLRERVPADGPFRVLQFVRGNANLTYLVLFGDTAYVLRRPPFGRIPPGAHDMGREYRTLSKLWQAFDRAPRAFVLCEDDAVAGASFVVMEYRPGVVIDDEIPESMRHHDAVGRRVGLAVVDALVDLHAVDPEQIGLDDLGRPEGFVTRQVAGWQKRWELVAPEQGVPEMDEVSARLGRTIPEPQRASVLHNDLKLDNCQFDPADPDRVRSVFDWDMATLGDPLIDLGTLLNYWPDASEPSPYASGSHTRLESLGLPTRAAVIERYRSGTGADLSGVSWYQAFAAWKTAVVFRQLSERYRRGETSDGRMADRGALVPVMARHAGSLLDA